MGPFCAGIVTVPVAAAWLGRDAMLPATALYWLKGQLLTGALRAEIQRGSKLDRRGADNAGTETAERPRESTSSVMFACEKAVTKRPQAEVVWSNMY